MSLLPDPSDRRDWERPGAFEVAPGVHRIPLPLPDDGLRAVNVYAIEDGDRLVLVDSGWALAESRKRLEAALASLGHDLGDVSRFLVTHAHRDHYTQAVVIRRLFGTRVALGIGEEPTLREIKSGTGKLPPRLLLALLQAAGATPLIEQLLAWSQERDAEDLSEWADPDEWLHGGTDAGLAARSLRVIATPGHTRGHVVFHDPKARLLFAGDHVLPHITPSIGFESVPSDRPLSDYLASLDTIAGLADSMLLPAHGPVQPSTSARIAQLIEHHRIRLDATLAVVSVSTAYAVARELLWTSRGRVFDSLDAFNQMLAVNETIAHLDVLADRGALRVTERDGVRFYAA